MEYLCNRTGQLGVTHRPRAEGNVVVRIVTQSRLAGHEIIGKALRYFGPEGLGFEIAERSERHARFDGRAGYVSIVLNLLEESRRTQVHVVGHGYEQQMREFIRTL